MHADGSARPQTVEASASPLYHRLLSEAPPRGLEILDQGFDPQLASNLRQGLVRPLVAHG